MSTIHNHPIMEREKKIDKYHVIVDRRDYEEALRVQKYIDRLDSKLVELGKNVEAIGKVLKELEA